MAEVKDTDRYDRNRNALKVCSWCGSPVAKTRSSTTVGMCPRHEAIWTEDIKIGLHIQNRLRAIMVQSGQLNQ